LGVWIFQKTHFVENFPLSPSLARGTSISKKKKKKKYFKWNHFFFRVCLLSRNEKSNWLSVNVTIGLYCFFFPGHSLTEQGHKQSKIVSNSMQLIHRRSIRTPHNPTILLSCMIKMFDLSEQPHKFQPRNIRNIKIRKSDFFEKTKTPQKEIQKTTFLKK